MTLHALRPRIGDADFFRLLRRWVRSNAGGNVTTPEFTALAERVSGQDLDAFFATWLFTPAKPSGSSRQVREREPGREPGSTRSAPSARRGSAERRARPSPFTLGRVMNGVDPCRRPRSYMRRLRP